MTTRYQTHPRNGTTDVAPADRSADIDGRDSLAARYAKIAGQEFAPRRADWALRLFDIMISGFFLVLLSPLILIVTLAILLSTGRPSLYKGPRVGRAGLIFMMYKFRTLNPDAEDRLGPYLGEELTRRTEDEVTGVGRVLRATHLDEVPQLFNVLKGDMSIVGPRPIRPTFFEELCAEIPRYWQRLVVRPGITGFAQTRMTREMSWAEKLAHDLEYIADRSVSLYFFVVFTTIWRIVRRAVAPVGNLLRKKE